MPNKFRRGTEKDELGQPINNQSEPYCCCGFVFLHLSSYILKFPGNFLPSAVLYVPKLPETVYYCFWVLRICFSLYCVLRLKTVVKKFRTKLWHWSWLENQTLRKKLTAKLNFKIKLVFSSILKFELSFAHHYCRLPVVNRE